MSKLKMKPATGGSNSGGSPSHGSKHRAGGGAGAPTFGKDFGNGSNSAGSGVMNSLMPGVVHGNAAGGGKRPC